MLNTLLCSHFTQHEMASPVPVTLSTGSTFDGRWLCSCDYTTTHDIIVTLGLTRTSYLADLQWVPYAWSPDWRSVATALGDLRDSEYPDNLLTLNHTRMVSCIRWSVFLLHSRNQTCSYTLNCGARVFSNTALSRANSQLNIRLFPLFIPV